MMAKVKIGDIIEVKTNIGYFYAQYTHQDSTHGALIQLTKNNFEKRPANLDDVANAEVGIITFFPLNIAVQRQIFPVIGNAPISRNRQKFPVFRVRGDIDKERNVKQWRFWDGQNAWPDFWIKELNDEQKNLPIRCIWNDTLLIERLESGYSPALDPVKI